MRSPGYTPESIAIIISHNCDIVSNPQEEPFVEVLFAQPVESLKAGCTHAQSPYRLHVEYSLHGALQPVELLAIRKATVNKEDLAGVNPDPAYVLPVENTEILQRWLAARYHRASFPDTLIERLRPIQNKLADVGKKAPKAIIGIWMSFDPDDDGMPQDVPYELWVSIVYSSRVEGGKVVASEAAANLKREFEKKFKRDDSWHLVDLRGCDAYSDMEFTVLDLLRNSQWRLEHLSMRQSPHGDLI